MTEVQRPYIFGGERHGRTHLMEQGTTSRHAMLWQPDKSEDFEASVRRAVAYYETKYGKRPRRVKVKGGTFAASTIPIKVDDIDIRIDSAVPPGLLWVH